MSIRPWPVRRYGRRRWAVIVLALLGSAVLAGGLLLWQHDRSKGLWRVVQRCAGMADHHPCTLYDAGKGYVLLKDREGQGQYLLLPTHPLRGIEEGALLHTETPDYLQQAWENRGVVGKAYGRILSDEQLSLAINARRGRSQEQLHIHMDCLRGDVRQALAHLPEAQQQGHVQLAGHDYRWWRLASLQPSPLLTIPFFPSGAEEQERSRYGLAVVALHGQFLLLQNRAHGLDWGHAEELQDHLCRR